MMVRRFVLPAGIAALALTVAIWLFGSTNLSAPPGETGDGRETAQDGGPGQDLPADPAAGDGRFPKVAIDERSHEFGLLLPSQEGRHTFIFRNEGNAPLILAEAWTNCRIRFNGGSTCEVPPGASAEVEMVWTHQTPHPKAESYSVVSTNDPNRKFVWLRARGVVANYYNVVPVEPWSLGLLSEEQVSGDPIGKLTGMLVSRFTDEFNILSVECPNPMLQATYVPLDERQVAEHKAKSGFAITVSCAAGMKVGLIRERLIVHTDNPDFPQKSIEVTGTSFGPYRFMAPAKSKWLPERMAVHLGQFLASEGGKAILPLIVTDLGEQELEIVGIESEVQFLEVSLQKNPGTQAEDRKFYRLTIEVPPGSPASSWPLDNGIGLVIQTNHPRAPTIPLSVHFVSL